MKPLIDGDILLHEIGWSCEFKDKDTGDEVLFNFDRVEELLNDKIDLICEDVNASCPPSIYITNSEWVEKFMERRAKCTGELVKAYKPIFRYEIAKAKPYKGNRKNPKPFHFYNIIAYLVDNYDVVISEDGLEADDMMCIEQHHNEEKNIEPRTIICSRDKDLRICPGWHYSWECGKQPSAGPTLTDELGFLTKYNGKTIGYGLKFFYYQMLVGDTADNIPGLPKWGDVKAFKALEQLDSKEDVISFVKNAYKESEHIENPKEYFLEQANLLWMIREKGKGFELS